MPITDPTDIAGLDLWLDFDDTGTLTLSGSDINQVDDKSGNANHFTPILGGVGPDYTASVLNGRGAAVWNATNTGLRNTGYQIPNPSTVFMMFMWTGMNAGLCCMLDTPATDQGINYHPVNSGSIICYATSSPFSSNTFQIDEDTPYYITVVFNGSSSLARWNGNAGFSGVDLGTGAFTASTNLGRRASAEHGFGNEPGSWCGEVIIYDSALGSTDYQDVETYLDDKWFTAAGADEIWPAKPQLNVYRM